MNNQQIIFYQPHLINKILYEFRGLSTPSALLLNEAIKTKEIIINKDIGFVIWYNVNHINLKKNPTLLFFDFMDIYYEGILHSFN